MNQNILAIDLTNGSHRWCAVPTLLRRLFLGGRGLNMYLLCRFLSQDSDPLSPQAPLIIGAGLLTGTVCPSASRGSVTARSPETGFLGDANFGGHFSAHLRRTGFDHLVVRGEAEAPRYLFLGPEGPVLLDAAPLWGMDTIETMRVLQKKHGSGAQVLCIGPAGENGVRFACVRHGLKSTAARGGLGCLMGRKKLKAIVVAGKQKLQIFRGEELKKLSRTLSDRLVASRTREALHKHGTLFLFDLHNHAGVVRTRNGLGSRFPQGGAIRSKKFQAYYTKSRACFGCRIACRHEHVFKDDSGKEIHGVGPEYGVLGAFGPICAIADPQIILAVNDRLNRLGLDAASTGNLIAWAMELYEQGHITAGDTGGIELTWGNGKAVLQCIEAISARKGFGDLLARGPVEASRILGSPSARQLVWSKNLLQSDSVDLRSYKGFALGVATASRGADHLRSRPTLEALNLPSQILEDVYGGTVSNDPSSYEGKARMVYRSELEYALGDALGICRFAQRFNSLDHLTVAELAQMTELAVGLELNERDLWEIGERIVTLERHLLAIMGLNRAHDTLPHRYFEPVRDGPRLGAHIDPEAFEKMLDEYYALHEWDISTGNPGLHVLQRLGITEALKQPLMD